MLPHPLARLAGGAALALALTVAGGAGATVFRFDTDPFAGSTALTTPGRQIVGGEAFLVFDPATDSIVVAPGVFDITPPVVAFNGVAADVPEGVNLVVLRDLDADHDPGNGVLMNAGLAANLIAGKVTTAGAGFFFYFNSGLDLVRLVYSTDLSTPTADLKVLARFTNLSGDTGRAALADLGPQVSAAVPEPAAWAILLAGFGLAGAALRRRRTGLAAGL